MGSAMVIATLRFGVAVFLTFYWSIACLVAGWGLGYRRGWMYARIRFGRSVMKAIGIDWKIHSPENIVRPAIYCSNHQSFLDVVLLPAMLPPETVFIAKREIKKVPFFGPAFAQGGAVLIDRSNPRGAIESIRQGIKELPTDWAVVIFPEGTRSTTGELRHFKKGVIHVALATGFPIVPMAVHGVRELTRSPRWLPRKGTVQIAVGEPIETRGWTEDEIDIHLAEVRDAVAEQLARARAAWTRDTGLDAPPVAAQRERLASLEVASRPE